MSAEIPIDEKLFDRLNRLCVVHEALPTELVEFSHGGTHPVSLALADAVRQCADILEIMEPEEIGDIRRGLPSAFAWALERGTGLGGDRDRDRAFLERLSVLHLATRLHRHRQRSFIPDVLGVDPSSGEAFRVFPELEEKLDEDGLLVVDDELHLMTAGVRYNDHVLRYHRFFGGDYATSPAHDLLWHLGEYHRGSGCQNVFRVAIDPRPPITMEEYERRLFADFSTWQGPTFCAAKLDDRNEVGLTVVGRDRPSPYEAGSGPAFDRTEFLWKHRDGVKTLEIEEITARENLTGRYHLNRYVHAERDVEKGRFTHLDGAVKVYSTERYGMRYGARLGDPGERPPKIKLFRVDGDIDIGCWLELVGSFFSGNEMVVEYFDPKGFEEEYAPQIREYQERHVPGTRGDTP